MKALIRNNGETILETAHIVGIEWTTGAPLTNPSWAGGPYTLMQNYVPQDDTPESYEEIVVDPVIEENEDDYIVINGVRYSKEELRRMIE